MHLLSSLVGTASLFCFAANSIATPINSTDTPPDVLKRQNTHPRQQWRTFRRGEQTVRSAPGNIFLQFEQRRFGGTIDYRFENDCLVRIYHNDYLMQTLGDEHDPSVQCTEPGSYGELSFTAQGFYEIVVYKPGQPPRRTWSPQWDVGGGRPEAGELEYYDWGPFVILWGGEGENRYHMWNSDGAPPGDFPPDQPEPCNPWTGC